MEFTAHFYIFIPVSVSHTYRPLEHTVIAVEVIVAIVVAVGLVRAVSAAIDYLMRSVIKGVPMHLMDGWMIQVL